MAGERPAKRPKIRLACCECRDRKIRCDGLRPVCGSCIRRKLPPGRCNYAIPGIDASQDYVQSLESRIRELEQRDPDSRGRHTNAESQSSADLHALHLSSAETLATLQYRAIQPAPSIPTPLLQDNLNPGILNLPSSTTSDLNPINSATVRSPNTDNTPTSPGLLPMTSSNPDPSPVVSMEVGLDGARNYEKGTAGVAGLGVDDGSSDGASVYLGRSSGAAFMSDVRRKVLKRRLVNDQAVEDGSTPSAASSASKASRARARRMEMEVAGLMHQLVLPPRRVADEQLENYWRHVWPFNPILHQRSFRNRYEEIWRQTGLPGTLSSLTDDQSHDVESIRAFYALFNILLALGSLYSDDAHHTTTLHPTLGDTCFERAESLINHRSMEHKSVISVQVFTLMAQYLQAIGKVNQCWVLVGTAIRTAQGLGIHLCPATESQAQLQERRRTWAYCVQMDRILGMMFGREPMVAFPVSYPPPDVVDDDLLSTDPGSSSQPPAKTQRSILSFFVHSVTYSEILSEILRLFYSRPRSPGKELHSSTGSFELDDYYQLLRLDGLLKDWHQNLPEYLVIKPDADFAKAGIFEDLASSTLRRYLSLKILLFRPAAVEAARCDILLDDAADYTDNGGFTELQRSVILGCARGCISAAQDMINVTYRRCTSNATRLSNWWHTTFYIFTASTVILAVKKSKHSHILCPNSRGVLDATWQRAMDIFAIYEKQGTSFARQCAWTLQAALDQGGREDELREAPREQSQPPNDNLNGNDNLADAILEDHWWQTAGLHWLDGVDMSENFAPDAHMSVDDFAYPRTE